MDKTRQHPRNNEPSRTIVWWPSLKSLVTRAAEALVGQRTPRGQLTRNSSTGRNLPEEWATADLSPRNEASKATDPEQSLLGPVDARCLGLCRFTWDGLVQRGEWVCDFGFSDGLWYHLREVLRLRALPTLPLGSMSQ